MELLNLQLQRFKKLLVKSGQICRWQNIVSAVLLIAWVACFSLIFSPAVAASPTEDEVKAAFIFNFAKFVEWPDMSGKEQITVGYLGEKPLSGNLALLEGRKAHALPIRILPCAELENMDCDILFIAGSEKKAVGEVLQAISALPVLTVSDIPGFARSGGMIGLVIADNKVRFEINLVAINDAGIKISSQLLSLAKEVLR